jgi:ribbon-helix-helix CopG family protein
MRTTLTLDEDIAQRLQAESRRTGRSFKEIVNEYLRMSLAQSRALKSMSPFRVVAADLGGPAASGSYDNIESLLEESEGTEHR